MAAHAYPFSPTRPGAILPLFCAILLMLSSGRSAQGQCFGTTLFPSEVIQVPEDGTPVVISTQSWPGDHVQVYLPGNHQLTYQFTSSVPTDIITISSTATGAAFVSGTTPVLFTPPGVHTYFMHIHASTACEAVPFSPRTTTVFRTHCRAGALNCGSPDEEITRVAIGSIDHVSSGCGGFGYSDFRHVSTNITEGGALPIVVENANPYSGDLVRVYVDWDRNFAFDDAGGSFLLGTTDHATFNGTISVPPGTAAGPVRMRVRLNYFDDGADCGFGQFGEVEDYTLNVVPFGSGLYAGGQGRGEGRSAWQGSPSTAYRYAGGAGRGEARGRFAVPISLPLSVVAVLEGPYNAGNGLMGDALRTLPSFPLSEPYTALGHAFVGGGGESIAPSLLSVAGATAIVDWVVVELRDASAPAVVVASRCALLLRNGSIVHTDGVSPVSFTAPAGNYHVAVLHRNHLGVMSSTAFSMSGTTVGVDLSALATATYGTQARKPIAGTYPVQALWCGDVTFDGMLRYTGANNDRDPILQAIGGTVPTATIGLYHGADVNMDGSVKYTGLENDRDPILQNVGGTVPTATRLEQLP